MTATHTRLLLCSATLVLGACASGHPDLQLWGSMRQVMRDGEVEARVQLADLRITPASVGVGALAGLDGEITISDGALHLATAADGAFHAETPAAKPAATLLVLAEPTDMQVSVCRTPLDEAGLAARLRATHDETIATVDVRGTVTSLDLHVARGACPHNVTTPQTEPWRWHAPAGTKVRLVGFYAPNREGTMTHHGTVFHLHAIASTPNGEISGHVDAFALEADAVIVTGGPGL